MTYSDWNNLLGDQLFKAKRFRQEVFLFLAKEQVVEAGRRLAAEMQDAFELDKDETLTDEYIWRNFLACVRSGPNGAGGGRVGVVQRAYNCYTQWQGLREKGDNAGSRLLRQSGQVYQLRYPTHLAYLLLFTMPFGGDAELGDTYSYYKTLNRWLHDNSLLPAHETINAQYFSGLDSGLGWKSMWQELEVWTIDECSSQLGEVRSRANNWPNWPYVGWPLAQCLLPPRVLQQLKKFFVASNLVPGMEMPADRMRKLLEGSKSEILTLPRLTRESLANPTSELGKSIVEMILGVLRVWNGSSNYTRYRKEATNNEKIESVKERGDVASEALPFLQIDRASERVTWQHRIRIRPDVPLPDDLQLVGENYPTVSCHAATPTWSTLLPKLGMSATRILTDDNNRWRCIYRPADVQLFVPASRYHLPNWAPASELEQGVEMMLLCREIPTAYYIRRWGESFQATGVFQDLSGYEGVPKDYCLFKLKNPIGVCPEVAALAPTAEGRIVAEGGIQLEYRRYLMDLLPAFRLINVDAEEPLHLCYNSDEVTVELLQDADDTTKWLLPTTTRCGDEFIVFVPGHKLSTDGLRYTLAESAASEELQEIKRGPYNDDLRARPDDHAGKEHEIVYYNGYQLELARLCVGDLAKTWSLPQEWGANSATTVLEKIKRQVTAYNAIFTPVVGDEAYCHSTPGKGRDELLHLLTTKGRLTLEEFSRAYDSLWLSRRLEGNQWLPTIRQKRGVMRLYAQMGFGDYGYRRGAEQIMALQPSLLPLPTKEAAVWRMLLTGGRTPTFVSGVQNYIKQQAPDMSSQILGPEESNHNLLLPDTIILTAPAAVAKKKFEALANACGIRYIGFDAKVPVELVLFAGSLTQYKNRLVPNGSFVRDGWRKKIFDPSTLNWPDVAADDESYKQRSCLLEYNLSDFERRYAWWHDGQPYQVDKNWGRYLALQAASRQVILKEGNEVAIPVLAPLPDMLAKALVLLSGRAPAIDRRNYNGTSRLYNVYCQPGAGLLIDRIVKHLHQH
ncbi:hypothetical protein [Hymenobacter bucti]|uniref:Uncharacterized protein n=1 Tax=Hymenobacter bucti TaxID=1844114 RepID=A0ABW4QYC8_9BACT